MNDIQQNGCIPASLMAELQEAADRLARGERDLEAAKRSSTTENHFSALPFEVRSKTKSHVHT